MAILDYNSRTPVKKDLSYVGPRSREIGSLICDLKEICKGNKDLEAEMYEEYETEIQRILEEERANQNLLSRTLTPIWSILGMLTPPTAYFIFTSACKADKRDTLNVLKVLKEKYACC